MTSASPPLPAPDGSRAPARLSRLEFGLLLAVALLVAAAMALPPLTQASAYHHFADARPLLGLPNALDVMSNVGFLALGVHGLWMVLSGRLVTCSASLKAGVIVTFIGFIATACGSSYYHLAPDDARLVVDRMGMVVAFAGVLGIAAAQRVSNRAGAALLVAMLVLGPCSVLAWAALGTLTPYAVFQFGGIALLLASLAAPARGPGPRWSWLVTAYAVAKLLESGDALVFELTGHVVSGHTLKHLAAALPVLAVTTALSVRRRQ
ncbi:MAG: hypothetical protein ABIO71_11280 [Caldimonas sp.]